MTINRDSKYFEGFKKRLQDLLDDLNVSRKQACKDIGVPPSSLGASFQYHRLPSGEVIARLAEYLGCSVDFLLYGKEGTQEYIETDKVTRQILNILATMTPSQKVKVLAAAQLYQIAVDVGTEEMMVAEPSEHKYG